MSVVLAALHQTRLAVDERPPFRLPLVRDPFTRMVVVERGSSKDGPVAANTPRPVAGHPDVVVVHAYAVAVLIGKASLEHLAVA